MEIVDMAWTLFSGLICGVLGVIIGAWVVQKRLFSEENIMKVLDIGLEYALKTKEGQEKVYGVGFLLGKAIGDGTGFRGKAGKGGIMQTIQAGVAQWIEGKILGGEQPETRHESSNPSMKLE